MEKISLKVIAVGNRKVPKGWHISQRVKMQRLYYIKGGTGAMRDRQGGWIPFEKGKLYVHPYNIPVEFISDPDDPIDHVYYDFISTPPIIANAPIVYKPAPDGAVAALIHATEAFYQQLIEQGAIAPNSGFVTPRNVNKSSEYGRIFRELLSALLAVLSHEKAIPFSDDEVIVDVLEKIRKNYMHPISVNALAAEAGFEVHYFIRRFKQMMGMTPYSYLRAYRLIKARELIDGGMSITNAAARVGYESPTALSRALKRDG